MVEIIIRCAGIKVMSEGEQVKVILYEADDEDLQDAYANIEREKYYELQGFTGILSNEIPEI